MVRYFSARGASRRKRIRPRLRPMSIKQVFIGTDGGATMSKVGGVWADGTTISTKLHQHPTSSHDGPNAVVTGWVAAVSGFLAQNGLELGSGAAAWAWRSPARTSATACSRTRRTCPKLRRVGCLQRVQPGAGGARRGARCRWSVGNDGAFGGVGEAQRVRGAARGGVLMLAPGSGLARRTSTRTGCRWRATRWPAWRPRTWPRRCTCSAPRPTRAAAAAPGAASRSTPRSPACRTCWPTGWRRYPITSWRRRPMTPQREGAGAARARAAGRRAGASSCSTCRRARWACTSPTCAWRWIRSSW